MPTTIPTVALDIRGEIFFSRPARGRSEAHRYSCRRSIRQRRLTIYSIVSHLTDAASKIIYRPKSPANGALVLEKLARHPRGCRRLPGECEQFLNRRTDS
jgi:hypothetical protein